LLPEVEAIAEDRQRLEQEINESDDNIIEEDNISMGSK
jgi:hypothetical protein